jgi:hypothetical protein
MIQANHGLLGPKLVRFLIENKKRWEEFRQRHRERARSYLSQVKGETARLATLVATISLALDLAKEAGCVPETWGDPFVELWPEIEAAFKEVEGPVQALFDVYEWLCQNSTAFDGQEHFDPRKGTWYGRWDDPWTEIHIMTKTLENALTAYGHDPDGTITEWLARGWLIKGTRGGKRQIRSRHQRIWCYSIPKSAFYAAGVFQPVESQDNLIHIDKGKRLSDFDSRSDYWAYMDSVYASVLPAEDTLQ